MTILNTNRGKVGSSVLFSEWIRRAIFWVVDFISGLSIRRHYADIRNIMENHKDSNVSKIQDNYLNNILNFATENVEFYKKYRSFDSIKSFPVINRTVIRNNYEAFQSSEFAGTKVVEMHTSGSIGAPFVVRQDKN